jgi:hypothetical protein
MVNWSNLPGVFLLLFVAFCCFYCRFLTLFQGEWRDDSQNGTGLWVFPSGQVYYGELRNGLYHGRGCIKFSNGTLPMLWVALPRFALPAARS